jgi:hypothetical protein
VPRTLARWRRAGAREEGARTDGAAARTDVATGEVQA